MTSVERIRTELLDFWRDEDGVATVELVLVLVVLIGLVLIFKQQINALLNSIFTNINSLSEEVY